MHVTDYYRINPKWTKVHIHKNQLNKLREFVNNSFKYKDGEKIIIPGATYGYGDKFYESTHNYSCVKTCNTWVNQALKYAGLPSCVWTPYNFGIIDNDSEVSDHVMIGKNSQIMKNTKIIGPCIIGQSCIIGPNVVLGPNVSIGDNTKLTDCSISNSIILKNCEINSDIKIGNSIIASNSTITLSNQNNEKVFLLGEGTNIRM